MSGYVSRFSDPDPKLVVLTCERYLKYHWMNFLGNFQDFSFVLKKKKIVRRSIEVLDPENQPGSGFIRTGSGTLGLTDDVRLLNKKQKEVLQNYLQYSLIRILNNVYRSRYWALDPAKTGSTSLLMWMHTTELIVHYYYQLKIILNTYTSAGFKQCFEKPLEENS